ncbi:hypothetical protein [Streptomyces montanisoli]|uniref:hypothetical protein n=1 Tax=Streptomyces montanisoli TaxID=2798581 RepID=UPI0027DBC5D0|nr:hypothetical protein [Streptomyces montanisoli]
MCAEGDPRDAHEPLHAPAPCRSCGELRLAEAVANAQRDYSRAADCRVLLRRHQASADCIARRPE